MKGILKIRGAAVDNSALLEELKTIRELLERLEKRDEETLWQKVKRLFSRKVF